MSLVEAKRTSEQSFGGMAWRALIASLLMWHLLWFSVALCVRFLSQKNGYIRYFSDASYWIYLIHVPITLSLVGLLAPWQMGGWVKAWTVTFITTIVTVVSYDLMVRGTIIGVVLNGRRCDSVYSTLLKG